MKLYSVSFHEQVAFDYNEAYLWYESQQSGLGDRFLSAVRARIEQILANPELYSVKSKPGYHETIIAGFPYSIVYKTYKKQNRILVTSVHHQKKHPRKKYRK